MRFYPADCEISTGSVALLLTAGGETQGPCVAPNTPAVLLRARLVGKFWISRNMRFCYSWQYTMTSPYKMWVKLHIRNKVLFLEVTSPPDLT